ncbi:NAD-dependent epimerase/dehydratase family protein [Sinorhizobium meliloti]|uniref:SDR family oxidoreductase n=1 Tax=Rhizobium meliloti TaxID=382 RepID=UPI0012948A5B|nr:SDR family oxidoreductase [Sinorhizobium meliloti]MDW9592979.1 NAD-dependent epimerase/dehydratase family protein [Sinorhizobium meliloti]MDX0187931.1 NAD-dependent epimerase/dehydratase family protein [Sinorhizobium meliloti]MQV10031.1 NAD-dependent epimerase/dehydratase family protein [Sinorhizobium meliloti]MQV61240.1 NAD-dependent epimerase/dehydratase family protein [Sinorhizobium meliloti]
MNVLILGAGYSGTAIASALASLAMSVSGTTRSAEKLGRLQAAGIRPILFDGAEISDELKDVMRETTHLVQSIAPGRDGDPMFRAGTPPLAELLPRLEWVGYLSTVGVYGDHGGAWVTEDTPLNPVSQRSLERVEAENAWLEHGAQRGIPVAVLRLAGIYGPGRNAFRNLSEGTARRVIKPNQVFNRIRVEDIGAATALLAKRGMGGVFNVTDDEPAPPQDVVQEAARLMGVEPPPEIPFETADMSPMARSFYGENKRVSNARLRQAGFDPDFPNYRVSLAQLWTSGTWDRK